MGRCGFRQGTDLTSACSDSHLVSPEKVGRGSRLCRIDAFQRNDVADDEKRLHVFMRLAAAHRLKRNCRKVRLTVAPRWKVGVRLRRDDVAALVAKDRVA